MLAWPIAAARPGCLSADKLSEAGDSDRGGGAAGERAKSLTEWTASPAAWPAMRLVFCQARRPSSTFQHARAAARNQMNE